MLSVFAIVCPPLAVLLTSSPLQAATNLGLTLFLYVPGVLHARKAVEKYSVNRQYDKLMRILDDRATAGVRATYPTAA
ncbi:YqaE/Pmp3 family membrane protein [Frigoriglobus tundricola]|uniref:YqaE/Pmp3 family membrane protein n=1 Tax=Frigoriglobus tundricola TaxID=2774151 RepID=A0A6M5YIL4_9BACT|nr:YqaE/Pmp3 family membrane protein [Frigoriglobus tundricola]QJW93887.1 hypothetical protein FTUN_1401 [Frigoriglobus tundricola]